MEARRGNPNPLIRISCSTVVESMWVCKPVAVGVPKTQFRLCVSAVSCGESLVSKGKCLVMLLSKRLYHDRCPVGVLISSLFLHVHTCVFCLGSGEGQV